MAADQLLGLELRALVGVAESLPDVEVVLGELAIVGRRPRRRSTRRRSAEPRRRARSSRQLEHPACPADVDLARSRSGSENETDAAQWTISATDPAARHAMTGSSPSRACSMSPGTAVTRPRQKSAAAVEAGEDLVEATIRRLGIAGADEG